MPVPLLDLTLQYESLREPLDAAIRRVAQSQHFIGGPEVSGLEREIGEWLGVRHAIACASGSDALLLALWARGIGPGDEVITTPFTFFATAGAVVRLGATPVFVDVDPRTWNIDTARIGGAVTPRTRAIIPVHLFGTPADMGGVLAAAERHRLFVLEDAAQSIGARWLGRQTGTLGHAAAFSFFPSKNLGAWGDAGLVTTDDETLAEAMLRLRSHGAHPRKYFHQVVGCNSRLDALQAAILRAKLPHLDAWNEARRRRAARYHELARERGIDGKLRFQAVPREAVPVYHQVVVRLPRRDDALRFLESRGIGTAVYYPRPLHLQECFAALGHGAGDFPESERAAEEALALPIFPELTEAQQREVMDALAAFLREGGPA
jgi:dTDP-4-amino-4,6-dideoxygalactose transaminase